MVRYWFRLRVGIRRERGERLGRFSIYFFVSDGFLEDLLVYIRFLGFIEDRGRRRRWKGRLIVVVGLFFWRD